MMPDELANYGLVTSVTSLFTPTYINHRTSTPTVNAQEQGAES
jgi:hypothetical protein